MKKRLNSFAYALLIVFTLLRALHGFEIVDIVFIVVLSLLMLILWRIGGRGDSAK